jgi:hypothetical protein
MTADLKAEAPRPGKLPTHTSRKSARPRLLQLPGLVAISLYMLLLSGITVVYVVHQRIGPVYLVFPVLFIAGALGLLKFLRWAWALTLAAVALMAGSFLWGYSAQHSFPSLVQGLLNLVFFLYLIRTDVREKLR